MNTTIHSSLELIEHMAKKLEDDAKGAAQYADPYERPVAARYARVAAEIGYLAKCLREGLDLVVRQVFDHPPSVIRMQDGAVFVRLDSMIDTLALLVDLAPIKERVTLLDDRPAPGPGYKSDRPGALK